MSLKIIRCFYGSYIADQVKLKQMGFKHIVFPKLLITSINSNQGFGQINGVTTEQDIGSTKLFPNAQICVFKKSTRELLWETKSKASGDYHVRNIAVGLECFVVAFDPNREYNAVIEDAVVAK